MRNLNSYFTSYHILTDFARMATFKKIDCIPGRIFLRINYHWWAMLFAGVQKITFNHGHDFC